MPVIVVGTKTDKFLKFEHTGDDPNTQQETLNNQIDAFRRIYEEKVKEVQIKFVFVSQGKSHCSADMLVSLILTRPGIVVAQTTKPPSDHCSTRQWAPLSTTECTEP